MFFARNSAFWRKGANLVILPRPCVDFVTAPRSQKSAASHSAKIIMLIPWSKAMGRYINPPSVGFELMLNDGLYVDKTELLAYTNAVMNTPRRFVCFTRPRRFGKTFAAQMLSAFYSKGAQSQHLFEKMKIAHAPRNKFFVASPEYDKYLNQCNVIFWDMTHFLREGASKALDLLQTRLLKELRREFPEVDTSEADTLADMICAINDATGETFYIIIDEWDVLFREAKDDVSTQKNYILFLRDLFKDAQVSRSLCGAYMTGILPIKKYGTSSALTDFSEFTMVDPGVLAEYVGFTTEEVQSICLERGTDFAQMQRWYDGYQFHQVGHVYNPNSVLTASLSNRFKCYWTQTETFEALKLYLDLNVEGLKDSVIAMLGGQRCRVDVGSFANDLISVDTRDKVLTLLVHLGYLAYDDDKAEVYIPNEEIREEFVRSFLNGRRTELVKAVQLSDAILTATLEKNVDRVAELLGQVHLAQTSPHFYANEQALKSVIAMAYLSAMDHYVRFEEIGAGRGYADMLFLPMPGSEKPALLIELKKDQSAQAAVDQIKTRQYTEVLERHRYHGKAMLIGITFDAKTNHHRCAIEETTIR